MKELERFIRQDLPNVGDWWSDSNYDAFVSNAKYLHVKGIEVDKIKEIMQSLYSAVADEFGV